MHLVTLGTRSGPVATSSVTTKGQKMLLAALDGPEPAQILGYRLLTPAE